MCMCVCVLETLLLSESLTSSIIENRSEQVWALSVLLWVTERARASEWLSDPNGEDPQEKLPDVHAGSWVLMASTIESYLMWPKSRHAPLTAPVLIKNLSSLFKTQLLRAYVRGTHSHDATVIETVIIVHTFVFNNYFLCQDTVMTNRALHRSPFWLFLSAGKQHEVGLNNWLSVTLTSCKSIWINHAALCKSHPHYRLSAVTAASSSERTRKWWS